MPSPVQTVFAATPADIKFLPGTTTLAIASGTQVQIIDAVTGAVSATYNFTINVGAIDISPDGSTLAVVLNTGRYAASAKVSTIALQTGTVTHHDLPTNGSIVAGFFDVAILSNGKLLLSQAVNGALVEYDTTSHAATYYANVIEGTALIASPDHGRVYVLEPTVTESSRIFTAGSGITATRVARPDPYAGASVPFPMTPSGAISPDGSSFVEGDGLEKLNTSLVVTGAAAGSLASVASGVVYSPDGSLLYVLNRSGHVTKVDTTTGAQVADFVLGVTPLDAYIGYGDVLQVSGNGRYLAAMSTQGVTVLDLQATSPAATEGPDYISGDGSSSLYGLGGNDTLTASNYTLLYGGPGDDTYLIGNDGSPIEENPMRATTRSRST